MNAFVNGAVAPAAFDLRQTQPFRLAGERELHVAQSLRTAEVADLLAHRVRQEPANLRLHCQRILLQCELPGGGSGPLYGALLDLFAVLDDKGQALRERMLAAAGGKLEASLGDILRAALHSGLTAVTDVPQSPHAVIAPGNRPSRNLVARRQRQHEALDPLSEARDCINNGQLELAQEILQRAARANPADQEIALELLGIHAHAGTTVPRDFIESLGNHGGLCPAWRDAAALDQRQGR